MKKKISMLLAVLITISVFSGCKKTDENTDGIPEAITITQMTTTEETTTKATTEATTEVTEETEETEETTEEVTTVPEAETTITTSDLTITVAQTVKQSTEWNETEISEEYYTSQACYSRKKAIVGAETVKQYTKGTKITVVAATDTGYYKLADGSFIHSDYLTDSKPAETAAATTAATTAKTSKTTKTTTATVEEGTIAVDSTKISTSYKVDYTTRYGYKTLTASEKKLYGNLVKAISNFDKSCSVPDDLVSENIMRVYMMVYTQEPQLFWMSASVPSGYSQLSLSYTIDDKDKVQKMQNQIDSKAKDVLAKVNSYSGTVSKIKVIYDYIVLNNDFQMLDTGLSSTAYNGIVGVDGLQCAGYAKAVMYLCDLAGIECMVIPGSNPDGDTHAWNKVYVDNGYYNLDATWGDPINKHDGNYIRYNFFLVPDEWIENSHLNPSTMKRSNGNLIYCFTPPAATKTACNYFKIYNKEFTTLAAAEKAMYEEFDAALAAKKNTVHIRVTDKAIYDKLISNEYAVAFQKYAKAQGASKLALQKKNTEGILVVNYDIFY